MILLPNQAWAGELLCVLMGVWVFKGCSQYTGHSLTLGLVQRGVLIAMSSKITQVGLSVVGCVWRYADYPHCINHLYTINKEINQTVHNIPTKHWIWGTMSDNNFDYYQILATSNQIFVSRLFQLFVKLFSIMSDTTVGVSSHTLVSPYNKTSP